MGTGAEFASIKNKMLLGFHDLGDRALGYLKRLHYESVQVKWDRGGVFNYRLELESNAIDSVEITGMSKATDGVGHIFDVTSLTSSEVVFENANAVTYYVGLFYSETPLGIRINARSGAPEYTGYREEIGRGGAPDTVTDNGNGTITFVVNGIAESGVSSIGRTVSVFRNIPAVGAISGSIAIEARPITFAGGDNTITTVGALGQSAVSTAPDDYTVILIGPSVTRNVDLRVEPECFFVGTVTGNGAGNTPDTFDNSEQFVFKTFEDASQIAYTPSAWLTAINVQDALDQFLAGLLSDVYSAAGSSRIGVNGTAFPPKAINIAAPMTTAMGGVGNVADDTLPSPTHLDNVLSAIDEAIRRVRVFTATVGDGSRPSDKDATAGPNEATRYGGVYFFRKLHNALLAPYTVTDASTVAAETSAYVIGETSSPVAPSISMGADRTLWKFNRSDELQYIPPGKYQRLFLDSTAPNKRLYVNGDNVAPGGIFEDVLFRGGNFEVGGMDTTRGDGAVNIRNSVFDPLSGTARADAATLSFGIVNDGRPVHAHFENTIFYGPLPEQVTPAPEACVHFQSSLGHHPADDRPLTFDNCVFLGRREDIPVILVESGHHVVFNNCYFMGAAGGVSSVIVANDGSHCVFNDCTVVAPEGQALQLEGCNGGMLNCRIITGTGTSVTNPTAVRVSGGDHGFQITNLSIDLDDSAVRPNGASKPCVLLGAGESGLYGGYLTVDGLTIRYTTTAGLHDCETLVMYGRALTCAYSNISVDCGTNSRLTNGTVAGIESASDSVSCVVSVIGMAPLGAPPTRCVVRGLCVENFRSPGSNRASAIVGVANAIVDGLNTYGSVGGSGTMAYALLVGANASVYNYVCADLVVLHYQSAVCGLLGPNSVVRGFELSNDVPTLNTASLLLSIIGSNSEVSAFYIVQNGVTRCVGVGGQYNLLADGVFINENVSAASPIYVASSNSVVRGLRGSWDGTNVGLMRVTGNNNVITGNSCNRSAGSVDLAETPGSGNIVVGNSP